jgi:hypothetical protein
MSDVLAIWSERLTVGQTFVFLPKAHRHGRLCEPALRGAARQIALHLSADYMTSVMRRRPPTAAKPMPVPGALVIAIARPPSNANTPTTAIVDRLT